MKKILILFLLISTISKSQSIEELSLSIIKKQQEQFIESNSIKKNTIWQYDIDKNTNKKDKKARYKTTNTYEKNGKIVKFKYQGYSYSSIKNYSYNNKGQLILIKYNSEESDQKLKKNEPSNVFGGRVRSNDSTIFIYKKDKLELKKTIHGNSFDSEKYNYSNDTITIFESDEKEIWSKSIITKKENVEIRSNYNFFSKNIKSKQIKIYDRSKLISRVSLSYYGGNHSSSYFKYNQTNLLTKVVYNDQNASKKIVFKYRPDNLIESIEYFEDNNRYSIKIYKY